MQCTAQPRSFKAFVRSTFRNSRRLYNENDRRCKMGGLKITNSNPAPRYIFEMLHADTDQLFLYFEVMEEETEEIKAKSANRFRESPRRAILDGVLAEGSSFAKTISCSCTHFCVRQ